MLSRSLAESGHFPAIDIEQSASRVMHNVVTAEHFEHAKRIRQLWSRFQRGRDLIQLGAYVPGSDPELDAAIQVQPMLLDLLRQDMHTPSSLAECQAFMQHILGTLPDGLRR